MIIILFEGVPCLEKVLRSAARNFTQESTFSKLISLMFTNSSMVPVPVTEERESVEL